jgi:hypothetical protein
MADGNTGTAATDQAMRMSRLEERWPAVNGVTNRDRINQSRFLSQACIIKRWRLSGAWSILMHKYPFSVHLSLFIRRLPFAS